MCSCLQDQQLDSEEANCQRQERAAQVVRDLKDEISRMKAAEQRKTDAVTSLAQLLTTVKTVTEQIADVRLPSLPIFCTPHVRQSHVV